MSFWELEEELEEGGSFDMGGGSFEPIPDNTDVLAAPVEAKWDSYEGDSYINIAWTILKPEDYANRRVFQKVKVNEPDSKKAEKAKRMLAAIDANAGGNLRASGKAPDDESLTKCLVNKQMIIKLMVWEINGKSGNWVCAVSPKGQTETESKIKQDDEDIGF